MEKEGLSRALKCLDAKSLQVSTLVTDTHKQIDKYMMKEYPDIDHCYDVWHISKGNSCKELYPGILVYAVGIKKN